MGESEYVLGGSTLEVIAYYHALIKGDLETARQALEQAHRENPFDTNITWNLGVTYQKLGRYEEGNALLKEAFKLRCQQQGL